MVVHVHFVNIHGISWTFKVQYIVITLITIILLDLHCHNWSFWLFVHTLCNPMLNNKVTTKLRALWVCSFRHIDVFLVLSSLLVIINVPVILSGSVTCRWVCALLTLHSVTGFEVGYAWPLVPQLFCFLPSFSLISTQLDPSGDFNESLLLQRERKTFYRMHGTHKLCNQLFDLNSFSSLFSQLCECQLSCTSYSVPIVFAFWNLLQMNENDWLYWSKLLIILILLPALRLFYLIKNYNSIKAH